MNAPQDPQGQPWQRHPDPGAGRDPRRGDGRPASGQQPGPGHGGAPQPGRPGGMPTLPPAPGGPRPPYAPGRPQDPRAQQQPGGPHPGLQPGGQQPGGPGRPAPRNPLQPGNLPRDPNRPREIPVGGAWSEIDRPPSTRIMPSVPGGPGDPVGPSGPSGPGGPGRPPAGPPRSRRTPGGVIAGRIVAGVLSVVVLAVCGIVWNVIGQGNRNSATSIAVSAAGTAGVTLVEGQTILLIGTDARTDQDGNPLSADQLAAVRTEDAGGGLNTDTIMLIHIPEGGGKATAVSIPRDTWIPDYVVNTVEGPYDDGTFGPYKPNKVNSFYGAAKFYTESALAAQGQTDSPERQVESNEAGRTMLIKVVQALTGLKIDHFAEVNLIGFYELSNALGGVPVCLNNAVDDPFSGAVFAAGPQEISGSDALAFVRQRHGLPGGDLDRVRRQQAFLSGATQKLLSPSTIGRLGDLVVAADKSLRMDTGFDLLSFATQMSGLSGGNVEFVTLPTTGAEQSTGADALGTDPAQLKAFFEQITGGEAGASSSSSSSEAPPTTPALTADQVTVDVRDGTIDAASGTPVWDELARLGFVRGQNTDAVGIDADTEYTVTRIAFAPGESAAGDLVQQALGFGETTEDSAVTAGHVQVTVGTDSTLGSGLRRATPAFDSALVKLLADEELTAGGVTCVN